MLHVKNGNRSSTSTADSVLHVQRPRSSAMAVAGECNRFERPDSCLDLRLQSFQKFADLFSNSSGSSTTRLQNFVVQELMVDIVVAKYTDLTSRTAIELGTGPSRAASTCSTFEVAMRFHDPSCRNVYRCISNEEVTAVTFAKLHSQGPRLAGRLLLNVPTLALLDLREPPLDL